MFTRQSTIAFFLSTLLCSVSCDTCQVKVFDNSNSFVCVCNETHCDKLDSGPHSTPNALTIFLSDKSAHRLTKSVYPDSLLPETIESDASNAFTVKVNTSHRLQSITGFGGAFTDASGININRLSPALQDSLIDDYYGPDGAEYTIGRVPIAGADFSDRPYSYDDVDGDFDLKHFALAKDDFDYKIPYIKKAKELCKDLKLFGSPWAPPYWLKTNNASNGLGILIGEPGSKHWKTWANYFVKFFDSYKENGIEFWGLTPQNEPLTGLQPGYAFNTCGFSSAMMKDFIKKDLGPTLKAAGYGLDKIKLMVYDHNNDEIWPFVRGVLSDKEAASYVAGVAFHWYQVSSFANLDYYGELDKVHEAFPDYFLLSTEACEGYVTTRSDVGVTLGNWTRAETYASDIIEGLNHWSTGWVDWNFALDPKGAPNWVANYVDAPVIVSYDGTEYYKQPMFYSLAHFSKFLRPGSTRVSHQVVEGKHEGIKMTTFVTPDNELVMIVLNTNDAKSKMTIHGVGEHKFTVQIGPRSLQTLIKPL